MQKNPARTTPLVSAVLPTKVISVCVPLDSRVGLARKVKIRLHVISFMEEMSVCPSVTKNSLYKLHGWSVGEVKQINY